MKKNIKKALLVTAFAALTIGSVSTAYAVKNHKVEQTERAYLLDFIHYCKNNEGLQQMNDTIDIKKSSLVDLKIFAKFYLEQDEFPDVTDYWDVRVIDRIVYPKTDGRVIYVAK